jgi:hypothetical protein
VFSRGVNSRSGPRHSLASLGLHQIDVANAKCGREFIHSYDGRIAPSALESTKVLLRQPRSNRELFLRQPCLFADPCAIIANQFPHIHAKTIGDLTGQGLSTIVCIIRSITADVK